MVLHNLTNNTSRIAGIAEALHLHSRGQKYHVKQTQRDHEHDRLLAYTPLAPQPTRILYNYSGACFSAEPLIGRTKTIVARSGRNLLGFGAFSNQKNWPPNPKQSLVKLQFHGASWDWCGAASRRPTAWPKAKQSKFAWKLGQQDHDATLLFVEGTLGTIWEFWGTFWKWSGGNWARMEWMLTTSTRSFSRLNSWQVCPQWTWRSLANGNVTVWAGELCGKIGAVIYLRSLTYILKPC